MSTDDLIKTLKTASETADNIAIKMLLLMAAEKLDQLKENNS